MTKPADGDAQKKPDTRRADPFAPNGRLPKRSIRFKVTLIAVLGTLFAAAAVIGTTAYAMQMILERTISNDLSDHLNKAQEAVEMGNFELAVQFAGSDIMQVIAEDGTVLASSANALGLAAIVDALDDEESYELRDAKLKEAVDDHIESSRDALDHIDDALNENDGIFRSTEDESRSDENRDSDKQSTDIVDNDDEDDDDADDVYDADDDDYDDASDFAKADDAGGIGDAGDFAETDDGDADDADLDDGDDGNAIDDSGDVEDVDDGDNDDDDDGDDDDDDASTAKARKTKANPRPPYLFSSIACAAEPALSARPSAAAPTSTNAAVAPKQRANDSNQTPSPHQAKAQDIPIQPQKATQHDETHIDASSVFGNEGPYLVMQRKVVSPEGPVTLAAMTSLASALLAAKTAAQLLVVVTAVLLVVVAFAAWRLTGRTLHPVEQMRSSVQAIRENDLSMRIPVPTNDRDLAPLASTFNDLLERIEAAVNRQKRFISDASHELKSPIAATGIMLETMREYPDIIDTRQVVDDLTGENERMARIVDNMLVLARHDEGRSAIEPLPVDLYDMLMEEASALKTRTDVAIDTSSVQPVVCTTDREQLGHIVRNLLDNAARYARESVKLTCKSFDDTVRITVSDDGPGIPEADRERVFERFVRLEDETHRKKDSTGLGLSVVKSTAERLGGSVHFTDSELGGARAIVDLPASMR